jgi:hypothetical protein
MRFDVYGRFQLEVIRDGDQWHVYRLAHGKQIFAGDLAIPSEVAPTEVATYLDDLFHEAAVPGKSVRLL